MARITISLPDALKDQLDVTAEARNISVSELVQQALKNLFAAPLNLAPAPKPQPVDASVLERLAQLEKHVAALSYEAEHLRQGMGPRQVQVKEGGPNPPRASSFASLDRAPASKFRGEHSLAFQRDFS